MQLTIVVQNLGHGGLYDRDSNPQDRWPLLAERIGDAAERVDAVMLTETACAGRARSTGNTED